jgi:hypothetical protein
MGVPIFPFKFRTCALRDSLAAVLVQLVTWLIVDHPRNRELSTRGWCAYLAFAQFEDEITSRSKAQI